MFYGARVRGSVFKIFRCLVRKFESVQTSQWFASLLVENWIWRSPIDSWCWKNLLIGICTFSFILVTWLKSPHCHGIFHHLILLIEIWKIKFVNFHIKLIIYSCHVTGNILFLVSIRTRRISHNFSLLYSYYSEWKLPNQIPHRDVIFIGELSCAVRGSFYSQSFSEIGLKTCS